MTPLLAVLGSILTAALLTVTIRRVLGGVGLGRTFAVSVVVVIAANPVVTGIGVGLGIFSPSGGLRVGAWTALVIALLVFLWCLVLAVALVMLTEIVAPSRSTPSPWAATLGARDALRRVGRFFGLAWNLAASGMWALLRRGPEGERFASALTDFLNRSGVTFVKLGQALSTHVDAFPPAVTGALARLQTTAEAIPTSQVHAVLASEWGETRAVPEISAQPLAAASIAQVHRARLDDGRRVVVKVQRPGARRQVAIDSDIALRFTARAERRYAWARSMGLAALGRGLVGNLAEELDYRVEASNTRAIAGALRDRPSLATPALVPELCTSRVLVMTELAGVPAAEGAARLDPEVRAHLARELLAATLEGIFLHGVFHTDLHPGNIQLLDDGRLGLLDFGSVGVLDAESRELLAALVHAFVTDDNVAATTALTMAFRVPDAVDRRDLTRDLGRVITRLAHEGDLGPAFGSLFTLMRAHGIEVPGDVAGAFRTLVSLEGTLRALDPELTLLGGARELMPGLMRQLTAPGRLASSAATQAMTAAAVARRLPGRIEQLSDLASRGKLTFAARPLSHEGDRRWVRGILADAVAALFAVAAVIAALWLVLAGGGPALTPQLSLYDLLGAAVGFLGAVLCLRVLARLRSGAGS